MAAKDKSTKKKTVKTRPGYNPPPAPPKKPTKQIGDSVRQEGAKELRDRINAASVQPTEAVKPEEKAEEIVAEKAPFHCDFRPDAVDCDDCGPTCPKERAEFPNIDAMYTETEEALKTKEESGFMLANLPPLTPLRDTQGVKLIRNALNAFSLKPEDVEGVTFDADTRTVTFTVIKTGRVLRWKP